MSTIDIPITLQVDVELVADALMARLRTAFITALVSPGATVQAPVVESEQVVEPPPMPLPDVEPPPAQPIVAASAVPESAAAPVLNDWLVEYDEILRRRPYKPQTLKNHRSCIKHIARLWGSMPLRSVRPRHVTAALQDAFGDRNALSRRVLDHFRDVMQEAVINEWCDVNPVLSARRPRVRVTRKRLSLETFDAMAEVAITHRQAWITPMLLLALATGQRRADLAKMKFDDIVDGHLHIEQQKEAGKGYGARVAIPLSLRLDAIGMTLGEVIDLCRDYAAPGPTLLRRNDGKCIELSSLSTRFNEVIRAALGPGAHGPGEWPSLHEMRSLSERLYRAQGIDTMTLLGHANQEMTDKYNDDRGLTAREWKRLELA